MKRPPTPKILLILLLILVLIVISVLFLGHHAKSTTTTPVVSETTPLPTPAQWPSTKVKDVTVTDNASYYTISAVYPVTKDAVISGYFKSFVDSTIAQFKSDTSWATGDGSSAASAEAGSLSLGITYKEQKNNNADNYIFAVDTYTGGAHDLESTQTYSFSPTGQQITLNTVFSNVDAGLKAVSSYVAAQLAKSPNSDSSMIADGTTPTADNFQNFTIQADSITFIFDPYQVAPYAEGQQTVTVPLSVFKSQANTDLFTQ